ncbi:MAG: hypothetical protein WCO45_19210 [Pseudanabaena sp. ELA607]
MQYAENLLLTEQADSLPKIAQVLEQQGIRVKWNQVLWFKRSEFLAQWLAPHIVGELLDLLCGHGEVGKSLTKLRINVTLTERDGIYPEDWKLPANLPYIPLSALTTFPPSRQFDTVLLCTVLHHEINSQALLALAERLATKRIIIVENCLEQNFPADYQLLMDILFNNSLNLTNLESPAVHQTVEEWLAATSTFGKVIHLERRASVPGVPLSHHLIVIEVNQ